MNAEERVLPIEPFHLACSGVAASVVVFIDLLVDLCVSVYIGKTTRRG